MKKVSLLLITIALGISAYRFFNTYWADFADDSWDLSFNGTLTISKDYTWEEPINPWASKRDRIKKIVIEDGVTRIGEYAFSGCKNLTSVTIPNSVTSIGWSAFSDCYSLTSITIPNSVTNMEGAFTNCTALTSITIPNSVENIDGAFSKCTQLTTITLPESITSIGDHTFFGCTSLKSITIPESVKTIGNEAFLGCSSLKSITCKAPTPPHSQIYSFAETPDSLLLLVPANSIDAYKKAEGWARYKKIQGI